MFLLLGNLRVERSEYEVAIRLFNRAQSQTRQTPHVSRALLIISLVSKFKFKFALY